MRVVSILLLGLLALPAFTSELDRLQETLECSTERNWEAYQCPQYNPNIQNYFILTDGSNSFTPIGMCMTKILETPTRDDFAKYCSNLIYKSPAALSDNIIDLCAKIALNREQEADRRNNLNLLFAFNKIIYKNLSRNSDLYLNNKNAWGYFHYKHWKKASECIRSLKQEAKAAKQPITFHLIGYSMGGGSIIKTFKDVGHEVSVGQIITLDPFRMNAGSLETMAGKKRTLNNLPSFQAWHNYHQNFDLSSLAGKIPLRGDELIDEWIENYKFTESDFEEVAKTRAKELPYILYTAHKHVQFTARVTQLIYNLLLTNP